MSRFHDEMNSSDHKKVSKMIDDHRCRHQLAKKQVTVGSKTSGLERRKSEVRNSTKRRKKRLYTLTPQAPNLAPVPEDEMTSQSDDEFVSDTFHNFKTGRRDSLGSSVSTTSDDEDQNDDHHRQGGSRPDYMNLGDEEANISPFPEFVQAMGTMHNRFLF